jgi:hypothetical protein
MCAYRYGEVLCSKSDQQEDDAGARTYGVSLRNGVACGCIQEEQVADMRLDRSATKLPFSKGYQWDIKIY